jgi:uncharacterized membrane protein AbrB (regulator of aidB expression)
MGEGVAGGILGLVAGWLVAAALQRAVGWIGVNSLVVIITMILGALAGFNLGGLAGAVIGALVGSLSGVMAIQLLFLVLKLAMMVLGAAIGWKLATTGD